MPLQQGESIGRTPSVAILLHASSHRRSFSNYFSQRSAVGVLARAWSMGVGLVMASTIPNTGDPEELIVERIDTASVALLAPVVGIDVSELVDRGSGAAGWETTKWTPGDVHPATGRTARRRNG